MAWSKPRNIQILNMVTRQKALWANTLGSQALLYSIFGVTEKTQDAKADLSIVAAGITMGMLYKCTGDLGGYSRTNTSFCALYNNWEHMKGSLFQSLMILPICE